MTTSHGPEKKETHGSEVIGGPGKNLFAIQKTGEPLPGKESARGDCATGAQAASQTFCGMIRRGKALSPFRYFE